MGRPNLSVEAWAGGMGIFLVNSRRTTLLTLNSIRTLYTQPPPVRWYEVVAVALTFAACNFLAWMVSVVGV